MFVQLLLEPMGEAAQALAAGVDNDRGNFPIQRIAFGKQLLELGARIGRLQQRPIAVVAACAATGR